MADRVRKVSYCYVMVPNRPGRGVKVLGELASEGVNLVAYSGFPAGGGKAQLDFVADGMAGIRRVARRNGWRLSRPKKAFVVTGADRPGAVHHHLRKLAAAGINITAADAVASGGGRYGMLLWVKARDYSRAAKALGARA